MAKKFIDVEKLERHFENCICEAYNTNGVTEDFAIALKATKNQPAADVQEIIRCKDCIYRHSSEFCECREPNFYCADGESMDGEENAK